MMRNSIGLSLVLLVFCCYSCGDDQEAMPAYCQTLAELKTDDSGLGKTLLLDDNRELSIMNKTSKLTPDTTYRVLAMYVEHNQHISLEAAKSVFSPYPVDSSAVILQTDPLVLKAIWISRRYINMLVGVKTGGGKQTFGFVDNGLSHSFDGKQTLSFVLHHEQGEDPLYYTQDFYMSCPIYGYEDLLVHGVDSVSFTINTFDGVQRKSFLY